MSPEKDPSISSPSFDINMPIQMPDGPPIKPAEPEQPTFDWDGYPTGTEDSPVTQAEPHPEPTPSEPQPQHKPKVDDVRPEEGWLHETQPDLYSKQPKGMVKRLWGDMSPRRAARRSLQDTIGTKDLATEKAAKNLARAEADIDNIDHSLEESLGKYHFNRLIAEPRKKQLESTRIDMFEAEQALRDAKVSKTYRFASGVVSKVVKIAPPAQDEINRIRNDAAGVYSKELQDRHSLAAQGAEQAKGKQGEIYAGSRPSDKPLSEALLSSKTEANKNAANSVRALRKNSDVILDLKLLTGHYQIDIAAAKLIDEAIKNNPDMGDEQKAAKLSQLKNRLLQLWEADHLNIPVDKLDALANSKTRGYTEEILRNGYSIPDTRGQRAAVPEQPLTETNVATSKQGMPKSANPSIPSEPKLEKQEKINTPPKPKSMAQIALEGLLKVHEVDEDEDDK